MYCSNYKTYDKASMNSKTPSLPIIIKHAMSFHGRNLNKSKKENKEKNLEKEMEKKLDCFIFCQGF